MYYNNSADSQQKIGMTQEQFDGIVEAIVAGKYSWACFLILRYAGYNPLHYIPYRTYIRLIKSHLRDRRSPLEKMSSLTPESSSEFQDLTYCEEIDDRTKQVVTGRGTVGKASELIFAYEKPMSIMATEGKLMLKD